MLEQLRNLRLHAMARCLEEQMNTEDIGSFSFEDRLGMMVDREMVDRENRRLSRRLSRANLKVDACMEDMDYRAGRGLDRSLMMSLASCRWIHERRGILITGPTGAGKTWRACAMAHKACLEGYTALYKRLPAFLRELDAARDTGTYDKLMRTCGKTDLIVLDDWGLEPFSSDQRRDLLEIMEDRHGRKANIVTSQLPVENWHEIMGDPTIADAILDRLVHNAIKITLKGESMRIRRKGKGGKEHKTKTRS